MSARGPAVATVLVGGGAAVLIRQWRRRTRGMSGTDDGAQWRWQAVTINRSPQDVMPDGRVPAPLSELGDLVEVEVHPASGDKGTELRARLRTSDSRIGSVTSRLRGDDPRQRVRSALREAKQVIEVGEVLRVDPTPHGRRSPTPTGALVEIITKRAGGEGVL